MQQSSPTMTAESDITITNTNQHAVSEASKVFAEKEKAAANVAFQGMPIHLPFCSVLLFHFSQS